MVFIVQAGLECAILLPQSSECCVSGVLVGTANSKINAQRLINYKGLADSSGLLLANAYILN